MPNTLELRVNGLFIGDSANTLVKSPVQTIEVNLEGIVGDKHAGFTKKADSRDRGIVRGTEIRNYRQWSAVESSEMALIAKKMGIKAFDPALVGPNIYFSGNEHFTSIPKGSLIRFPNDAILYVEGENLPCIGPGEKIAEQHPSVKPTDFPKAAIGLRGLVGSVHRAGVINVGDIAQIEVYRPRLIMPGL